MDDAGSEVEQRIHKALAGHALERIERGYRLVHPQGAGISTLRLLPANVIRDELHVVAVAEVVAEYNHVGLPPFSTIGVQRLNSWAVHGAYRLDQRGLRQTAQYSIYASEPAAHLAAQSILNAFGAQLPIGRSTAMATASAAALRQQRTHHAMPARWPKPFDENTLNAGAAALQQRGLAAAYNANGVWAEFPLSGDCPSRAIDPQAETALLQVNVGVPHPVAGAGYLATISLPLTQAPPKSAQITAKLNELELAEADFVPRLGAWGLHAPNDLPGYSCFIPSAQPVDGLHMTLMWWCVRRAAWLRERFWAAKAGLTVE